MFWKGASLGKGLELKNSLAGLRSNRKVQVAEAGWLIRTRVGRGRPCCRVLEATVKVSGFASSVVGRCWRVLAGE